MGRSGRVAAVLAAVLVATGSAIGPAGAWIGSGGATAPRAQNHYLPVAGNKHYLVYVKAKTARPLGINWHDTRRLYVLDRAGDHRFIGSWQPTQQSISLVASTLITYADPSEGNTALTWWNLATGTSGTATTDPNEATQGAARGGWVAETMRINPTMTPSHLVRRSFTGGFADLGAPLPFGVGYGVTTAGHGLVAFANNDESGNGQIVSMPWTAPGQYTTLLKPGDSENGCAGVSRRYVTCWLYGRANAPDAIFRFDGGKPTLTRQTYISGSPLVLGAKAVGVSRPYGTCPGGEVDFVALRGKVTRTKPRYHPYFVVTALGRAVVASPKERRLVAVKSASSKPRVLVGAGSET